MSLLLIVRFLHIASATWFIGGVIAGQIVRAYIKADFVCWLEGLACAEGGFVRSPL